MGHALVKATLIPDIVELIAKRYDISEMSALDRFYSSVTAENLADDETGLYGQSALFIYGMYCSEMGDTPYR